MMTPKDFKPYLPFRKKWKRYTIAIIVIFHIVMINLRDMFKDVRNIDLIVIICYGLFWVAFAWFYYKHPEKFRD